eukprot:s4089_g2.t1
MHPAGGTRQHDGLRALQGREGSHGPIQGRQEGLEEVSGLTTSAFFTRRVRRECSGLSYGRSLRRESENGSRTPVVATAPGKDHALAEWLDTDESKTRAAGWTLRTTLDELVDEGVQHLKLRDWIRQEFYAGRPMLPLKLIQRCRTLRDLASHVTFTSEPQPFAASPHLEVERRTQLAQLPCIRSTIKALAVIPRRLTSMASLRMDGNLRPWGPGAVASPLYSRLPTNGNDSGPDVEKRSPPRSPAKSARSNRERRKMLVTNDESIVRSEFVTQAAELFPTCGSSLKEAFTGLGIVVSIYTEMPPRHLMHFLFVFFSYLLVVLTGAVQMQLVDTSFFRAVGLLLAVLLSLRAKNAVSRRQKLMAGVLDMMNSAKNLLYLLHFEPKNQLRLRRMLEFCFMEVAAWAAPSADGDTVSLDILPDEYREAAFLLRAKQSAHISPRPLLLYLREMCDQLFDPDLATSFAGSEKMDKVSIIRRFHRNMEDELHMLFSKFDFLLMFRENFVTSQFRWMLETVIFVYVVLYPWCVCNESNVVLGATTVGMACVFYGLNALTEQLEDPVHHQAQGFDLWTTFVNLFEELDRDDAVRDCCRKFLEKHKAEGNPITENLHRHFEAEMQDLLPPAYVATMATTAPSMKLVCLAQPWAFQQQALIIQAECQRSMSCS